MKLTLSNSFHGTQTAVRVKIGEVLSARRVASIRARLCGVAGCKCSGVLGTRGVQAGFAYFEELSGKEVKFLGAD